MKNKKNFEEAMKRLEEIAGAFESGDLSLEDSIKIYEEGTQLIEFCQKKLDEAEKKVQKLTKTADGGFEEEPFEGAAEKSNEQEN